MSAEEPLNVVITGAAGQIGYAIVFRLATGALAGDRKVKLHLLEITPALGALNGVCMELQDLASPQLAGVVATDDPAVAFKDADVVFLVGAFPRKDGMDRSDLLMRNSGIFEVQGKAINDYARKTVRVLVVGNPANTNCAIALANAPSLKPENFCAMTRLDHNRATAEIARRCGVTAEHVKNCIIWGNHSNTQVVDTTFALCDGKSAQEICAAKGEPLDADFRKMIATRGGAVIKARGLSSAASAANAAIEHMKSWMFGTKPGEYVSMGIPVPENKPYGIETGVVFSFPCEVADGKIHVVEGLAVTEEMKALMLASEEELKGELKALAAAKAK